MLEKEKEINSAPSCWEEAGSSFLCDMKKKMDPSTYSTSCSFSLSLSFPPSLSLSLSLSPLQILECAFLPPLRILFLDPLQLHSEGENRGNFPKLEGEKKKNLFAAVGAHQARRSSRTISSRYRKKHCYYKNVLNVVIFHQRGEICC